MKAYPIEWWSIGLALSREYDIFREIVSIHQNEGLFPSGSRIHEAGQAQIGNDILFLGIVLLVRLLAGVDKLTSIRNTEIFSQSK